MAQSISLRIEVIRQARSPLERSAIKVIWSNPTHDTVILHPYFEGRIFDGHRRISRFVFGNRSESLKLVVMSPGDNYSRDFEVGISPFDQPDHMTSTTQSLSFYTRIFCKPGAAIESKADYFNIDAEPVSVELPIIRDGLRWLKTDYGGQSLFFEYDGAIYTDFRPEEDQAWVKKLAPSHGARVITHQILLAGGRVYFSDYRSSPEPKADLLGLNEVFYRKGEEIMTSYGGAKVAEPENFVALPNEFTRFDPRDGGYCSGYGHDGVNAYFFDEGTSGNKANVVRSCKSPETLRSLGFSFAKDDTNVYWEGKRIKGADTASFRVLNRYYAIDFRHVWWWNRAIPELDAASFELIPDPGIWTGYDPFLSSKWGKDKNGLIEWGERCSDAEYEEGKNRHGLTRKA